MTKHLELIARALADGSGWELLAPSVGYFGNAPQAGDQLSGGTSAGTLTILNLTHQLSLPNGVTGWVDSQPSAIQNLAVQHGQTLFTIKRSSAENLVEITDSSKSSIDGLIFKSPQAGRFYRRPDPHSPLYCEDGDLIKSGKTVGLLEVMKTFNPVKYQAIDGLPENATIKRFFVEDGADVAEGEILLELN